jgi:hypothetical protein
MNLVGSAANLQFKLFFVRYVIMGVQFGKPLIEGADPRHVLPAPPKAYLPPHIWGHRWDALTSPSFKPENGSEIIGCVWSVFLCGLR